MSYKYSLCHISIHYDIDGNCFTNAIIQYKIKLADNDYIPGMETVSAETAYEVRMKILKKVIVLIIGISLFYANWNQYNVILKEFKAEAEMKEFSIGRHIDLSSGFMELMRINGESYIHNDKSTSKYFKLLVYDKNSDTYYTNLTAADLQPAVGSLTGLGPIPQEGITNREINLALQLNSYFQKVYELIPDIAWLYYTSDHNFISMFPWISYKEFSFSEEIKQANFFACAGPESNPDRKSVWTPVYRDYAGKGLMVTYSCPLYYEDEFLGIISLDYTNSYLSEVINSEYESYLTDQTGTLIATGNSIMFAEENIHISDTMKFSEQDWAEINNLENDTIKLIGSYYVYKTDFANAPWTMYFRIPIWKVIVRTLKFTGPVIIICFLLAYAFYEIEKRKKTEIMLSETLKERKEYQELLENAAKYDFLTSTLNRRGMEEKFSQIAIVDDTPVFFIMGDLDRFKKLNDTYGHDAGDKVLIETAGIMKRGIDSEDLVCRWGGEEFLLVLINKKQEEALNIAEKIRQNIEAVRISWNETTELKITITLGMAEFKSGMQVYNCITDADNALYHGKRCGRNQVVVYTENIGKSVK